MLHAVGSQPRIMNRCTLSKEQMASQGAPHYPTPRPLQDAPVLGIGGAVIHRGLPHSIKLLLVVVGPRGWQQQQGGAGGRADLLAASGCSRAQEAPGQLVACPCGPAALNRHCTGFQELVCPPTPSSQPCLQVFQLVLSPLLASQPFAYAYPYSTALLCLWLLRHMRDASWLMRLALLAGGWVGGYGGRTRPGCWAWWLCHEQSYLEWLCGGLGAEGKAEHFLPLTSTWARCFTSLQHGL